MATGKQLQSMQGREDVPEVNQEDQRAVSPASAKLAPSECQPTRWRGSGIYASRELENLSASGMCRWQDKFLRSPRPLGGSHVSVRQGQLCR